MAQTIFNSIFRNCFSANERLETENVTHGKDTSKRGPSVEVVSLSLPNGFSGKLLFHLTSVKPEFLGVELNGKHPISLVYRKSWL